MNDNVLTDPERKRVRDRRPNIEFPWPVALFLVLTGTGSPSRAVPSSRFRGLSLLSSAQLAQTSVFLDTFIRGASSPGLATALIVTKTALRKMLEITRREEFSASHRLHNPQLSDEQNVELYGPCNNLHGHGHNYALEVCVRGEVPESGMVMDLNVLQQILAEEVVSRLDHKHLNHDVDFLHGLVTTAENIAVAIFEQIEPRINAYEGSELSCVRVFEIAANFVEYRGAKS